MILYTFMETFISIFLYFFPVKKTGKLRDQQLSNSFPLSSVIKIVLPKNVVLIMRIIKIIINMDDIRQERPNENPILKKNERVS